MSSIHLRYLNHHLTRQLNELYVSTVIFSFGVSLILLFTPIYFYKLGFSLVEILLYFALHYFAYTVLMPPLVKITAKIGYEYSIGYSMPLYAIYIIALLFLPTYPILFYFIGILNALHKCLYWPAFHADFSKFGKIDARGEEVSSLKVLVGLVSIIGPTIGGFMLSHLGFSSIFIASIILAFLSLAPLLVSKEKLERENFSIKQIWQIFKNKNYKKDLIANLGTGEDVIAQAVWPIFMLTIFANYQDVGILTTIALFIAFIIILIVGKLANNPKKTKLIKTTTVIVAFSWLARVFSFNWLSVFASDSLYKISKQTLDVPVQALIYERPGKKNLLNYLVFREMALSVAKSITALVAIIAILITGEMLSAFAIAAAFTLFYFYWEDKILPHRQKNLKTPY